VFGKQDNTAINLSAIVAGTGGFVINGESENDDRHPQLNHLSHRR
jgi:hypothetical protein